MINRGIPPCGVIDELLRGIEFDPVERYRFWLLLHTMWRGDEVVRKMVVEQGVQAVDEPMGFVALIDPFGFEPKYSKS